MVAGEIRYKKYRQFENSRCAFRNPVGNFPNDDARQCRAQLRDFRRLIPRSQRLRNRSSVVVHPLDTLRSLLRSLPLTRPFTCELTRAIVHADERDSVRSNHVFRISIFSAVLDNANGRNVSTIFFRIEIRVEYEAWSHRQSIVLGKQSPRTKERASSVNTKIPFTSLAQT